MIWLSDRNWLQGLKVSSLAHMIKEYSPKAKSMPLLIHIILILVTLPSLQVLGGGSETPSMALKTFTPWHIPLSSYLLSRRWQYRFCWRMSIAKHTVQKRASGTGHFSISLRWRVKQKSELYMCVWKTDTSQQHEMRKGSSTGILANKNNTDIWHFFDTFQLSILENHAKTECLRKGFTERPRN